MKDRNESLMPHKNDKKDRKLNVKTSLLTQID